jgi:hypothetical protein
VAGKAAGVTNAEVARRIETSESRVRQDIQRGTAESAGAKV